MKNLMRILSILIIFVGVILALATAIDFGEDFNIFANKLMVIFAFSLPAIITFTACAYCLERNDNNYFVRVFPLYALLEVILITILIFFDIDEEWCFNVLLFLSTTTNGVALLSLTMVVKANNSISSAIKYVSIGTIILCTIFDVIQQFDTGAMLSIGTSIMNIYANGMGANVSILSFEYFDSIKDIIFSVSTILEVFSLVLLYITNYAFSDTVQYDNIDIDYEAVKQDAFKVSNMKMNEMYNAQPKETTPVVNENPTGMMNINNQLSQNSNVGTVTGQAKEVNVSGSALESLMPLSNGPVINQTMTLEQQKEQMQNNNVEVQQVQVQQQPEQQAQPEPTIPPNQDIQEQMKMRMQNVNQAPQQNINQMSQQNINQYQQQAMNQMPQQNINNQ